MIGGVEGLTGMSLRHAAVLAVWALLFVGCANPAVVAQQQAISCDTGPSTQLTYFEGQLKPRACIDYSVAEMERQIAEDKKRQAEQQRAKEEAARELLAESPVHDEQTLQRDVVTLEDADAETVGRDSRPSEQSGPDR